MTLWTILKNAVEDIETANDVQFGEQSWQRVKQLEKEINAYFGQFHYHPITNKRTARSIEDTLGYLYFLQPHIMQDIRIKQFDWDFSEYERLVDLGYLGRALYQPDDPSERGYIWTEMGWQVAHKTAAPQDGE